MAAFDKHRKRRIICNDDGDQQRSAGDRAFGYNVHNEQSFLNARTTVTFDSHVDTYVWCVGNGADPPYSDASLVPGVKSASHANDLIVEKCHARGMEVWASLRMNDIHDSRARGLEHVHDNLKRQHPKLLVAPEEHRHLPVELAERSQWTVFNYARPEVRQHRLNFIRHNASAHDFDGYELDFTRHGFYFPLGRERELAPKMTDLIRQVRARLNDIGEKRGRPFTFVVHVNDSVESSLGQGHDVVTWLQEGLIDVLIVGAGYLPYAVPCHEWVSLGKHYGVPIYPSVNTNTYLPLCRDLPRRPQAFPEAVRAHAAHYWHEGFEGQYLFNLFCMDEKERAVPPEIAYQVLNQIGDPAALAGTSKIYCIQGAQDAGGNARFGSGPTPLPIALVGQEHRLPLQLGPDGGDPNAKITITALANGDATDRRVWLRLNHRLLPAPTRTDLGFVVRAPAGFARPGRNELSIWASDNTALSDRPIVVYQVVAHVEYER